MIKEPMLAHTAARWKLVFSALLLLALLAAALPQAAHAQTQTICRTYHLVREGNTKPFIANTYGVKWKEIAAANDLNVEAKPEVGSQLCIPEVSNDEEKDVVTRGPKKLVSQPDDESRAIIEITTSGGQIRIHTDNFNNDHVYLAKARAADGTSGWYRLGIISVPEDDSKNSSFNIPQDLRSESGFHVCLKDQTTDELVCRSTVNP